MTNASSTPDLYRLLAREAAYVESAVALTGTYETKMIESLDEEGPAALLGSLDL